MPGLRTKKSPESPSRSDEESISYDRLPLSRSEPYRLGGRVAKGAEVEEASPRAVRRALSTTAEFFQKHSGVLLETEYFPSELGGGNGLNNAGYFLESPRNGVGRNSVCGHD